ncbi:MAG: hypothetical protein V3U87_07755 [Methylococcaceae bacterium]
MRKADCIIFMGISFSANITNMTLNIAIEQDIPIEIADPEPVNIAHSNTSCIR